MLPAGEVIGIDHIYLTVSSLDRAEAFYDQLLQRALGFRKNTFLLGADPHVQYFNRLLGIVLRPARTGTPPHDPYAPGLHHLCLRVDSTDEVGRMARDLGRPARGCPGRRWGWSSGSPGPRGRSVLSCDRGRGLTSQLASVALLQSLQDVGGVLHGPSRCGVRVEHP